MVFLLEQWIFWLLALIAFIIEAFAFLDVLRRPKRKFLEENKRTKNFWLLLTGASALVGLYSLLTGAIFSLTFVNLLAVVAASVYLADVRRAFIDGNGNYYRW